MRSLATLAFAAFLTFPAHAEDSVTRGAYLARIMDCGGCHTPGAFSGKPNAAMELAGADVGFAVSKPEQLRGGDADTNAAALREVLKGKKNAFREVALLNAAAAIVVSGKAKDLKDGLALATKALDSGEADARLEKLVTVSNG